LREIFKNKIELVKTYNSIKSGFFTKQTHPGNAEIHLIFLMELIIEELINRYK